MRISLLAGLAALAFAFPAAANTPTTGTIIETAGDAGSVLVFRNGLNEVATVGKELRLGDRLVTRPGGSVEFSFGECRTVLPESDTIVLSETLCTDIVKIAQDTSTPPLPGGQPVPGAGTGAAATGGSVSPGAVVGVVLGAGAIGGIVAAAGGGGGDDAPAPTPVSP